MFQNKLLVFLLFFVLLSACGNNATTTPSASNATAPTQQNKATTDTQPDVVEEEDAPPPVVDPKDILAPMKSIQHLDEMIESYSLGQNLTQEQIDQNTALKKNIIRGTFDIRELCHLSLGKHWETISKSEQKQFVKLMTTLLETKAIFSKEQLKGSDKYYQIKYKKETYDDPERKKATVFSDMIVPKEKITLAITYKMLLTPYGWKIYDVIVDDASLLANYKFQFDRIITEHGFTELIARMDKKLGDIKSNKPATPKPK